MRRFTRRAMVLASLGVVAIPLGVAATAYACTAVATLTDSPGVAVAGSSVTVSGAFFGTHNAGDATTAGPVQIRLGSLTGPVLATANPSGVDRSFSVQVAIPQGAQAGDTFLTATQATASGTPVYGTPARQAFTVTAAPAPSFAPVVFAMPAAGCVVPNVTGKSLSLAKRLLTAAHCAVGKITAPATKRNGKHHKLVVASSGLSAGMTSPNGTKISLRLRWS